MLIPARILRAHAMDVAPSLRDLTAREIQREELILTTAAHLLARFGAAAISFTNLAIAIKVAPSTLRKHFPDFPALLGEIMRRHLQTLVSAIAAVPRDAPDRRRLQRAAYIEATRFLGAPTAAHLILVTHRTTLPDDERESVNAIRDQIGEILAGANGEAALNLLDCSCYDTAQIERMLIAAFCEPERVAAPTEAPPPPVLAAAAIELPPRDRARPVTAADLINENGEIDLSRISGVDIPGGPFGAGEPDPPWPWDTPPSRLLPDAELHRMRTKPPIAA